MPGSCLCSLFSTLKVLHCLCRRVAAMGSFLSSSSSHQAEDNACISQEDLNESIDLALAVAMSVQPSEEAPPTSDWLRLCQQCGQLSYIRQGCCLNTLCSLSYMAVDPATLGHRLQSWGSPDGSAVASPQKLEEQRIKRKQHESQQWYQVQGWKNLVPGPRVSRPSSGMMQ